ncbi:c-type cytochrome [Sphingomonas sp. Y38-1Y]|uniref:c-type cytochrome n=1 Tax=Sphingomonas sp. Y38-1Y TaxID=3078265 RepID=UPI0028EA2457|nr:c-type cytochrome [Sphingomonas sp. Y38-1Y]
MRAGLFIAIGVAAASIAAAAPPSQLTEGERLATILGCRDCHGATLEGKAMLTDPKIAVFYSSNLTRALPRYTDKQLDHVLSTGERPDGTRLWYMDAAPYAVMSRADKRALFAWLRAQRPSGPEHPRIAMGPRFKAAVEAGRVKLESATLARDLANPPSDLGPATARGRYLARTVCAGCHASSLKGVEDAQPGDPPSLSVVAGYDRVAFATLMKTGLAPGDRKVGEMTKASQVRLHALKPAEVDALYDYLSRFPG